MLNACLYLALRLAAALLPWVPLRAAYLLADAAGAVAYPVVRSARAGILSNLAVAFPELSTSKRRALARRALQNDARNWTDTLRISRVDIVDLARSVDVEGWEHLDAAVAAGRGVIVVTLHLGNFDLVGQLLAARGLELTVPVERVRPPRLFEFLRRQRASRGIHIVPVERAPRVMLAALRRGELVGMAADRLVSGRAETVQFFDRPTSLPRGTASLARHSGATVLIGVGLRRPGNRFLGLISAPVELPNTADIDADELIFLQRLAGVMEGYIRRYPDQWMAFSPLWPDDNDGNTPATIGQQREAAK